MDAAIQTPRDARLSINRREVWLRRILLLINPDPTAFLSSRIDWEWSDLLRQIVWKNTPGIAIYPCLQVVDVVMTRTVHAVHVDPPA